MNQLVLPVRLAAGAVLKVCSVRACTAFKVLRVQRSGASFVHQMAEVAGTLAMDPAVAMYDELLKESVDWQHDRKNAVLAVCRKFGIKRRAFYYRLSKR